MPCFVIFWCPPVQQQACHEERHQEAWRVVRRITREEPSGHYFGLCSVVMAAACLSRFGGIIPVCWGFLLLHTQVDVLVSGARLM